MSTYFWWRDRRARSRTAGAHRACRVRSWRRRHAQLRRWPDEGMLLGCDRPRGACSIQHRSDEYACTKQSDCNNGPHVHRRVLRRPGGGDRRRLEANRRPARTAPTPRAAPPAAARATSGSRRARLIAARRTATVRSPAPPATSATSSATPTTRVATASTARPRCRATSRARATARAATSQCGLGPCDVSVLGSERCRSVACEQLVRVRRDVYRQPELRLIRSSARRSRARAGLGCTSVPTVCHSCP